MRYWWYHPEHTFTMWDTMHILTIICIFSVLSCLYLFRGQLFRFRDFIRISIGLLLMLSRISLDCWYILTGEWSLSHSLPFELCSIASLVSGIMLLTKSRFLFRVFYFIAIGGALQAILTPALDFGFPQYRYLQFFVDHTLLISAPLILIFFYQYRLRPIDILKAFIAINCIALIVFCINILTNANYMFLNEKPSSASLLDFLGAYPYYLLALEGIVLIIFSLLYLFYKFIGRSLKV